MNGLISQTLNWITHPSESEGTPLEWLAGLVVVLFLAWGWKNVVDQIQD